MGRAADVRSRLVSREGAASGAHKRLRQRVELAAGVRTLAVACAVLEATPGRLISGHTEQRVDSTSNGRAWEIEAHQVRVTVWLAGGGLGWGSAGGGEAGHGFAGCEP